MKVLRWILLYLLASLLFGMVVGTIIRMRLEGPAVRYFVDAARPVAPTSDRPPSWATST